MGAASIAGTCAGGCLANATVKANARLIVDNDFAGDPDGLAALVHQLLSPSTRVSLITSSALDQNIARLAGLQRPNESAAAGANLTRDIVNRIAPAPRPGVVPGTETFGVSAAQLSMAAEAIVAEASRSDPLPLILTCGGPLTNVAAALRIDPSIADKMTLIWVGGGGYPAGGGEYNLMTDLDAARQVVEQSRIPLWQIPETTYKKVSVAFSELELAADPDNDLAQWTYAKLIDVPAFVKLDGARGLGDSSMVLLTALSADAGRYETRPARRLRADGRYDEVIPGRTVRVYEDLDSGLVVRDFISRLRLSARHLPTASSTRNR